MQPTITIGEDEAVHPDIIKVGEYKTSIWTVPKGKKLFFKCEQFELPLKILSMNPDDRFMIERDGNFGIIIPSQDSQILGIGEV